ncbi:acetyl-CoA carboxylase biotin carboxyl carrier protein [Fredinandcohnia quinoae]|uniref:Biotin carboxyl carrier protein of acetyl-CoA carboxylase n=1 Tax=Fredinandcohnia quinoae TaxID=2918902 RepID=A0AAW5E501_9BACI|nr:acetyl-CoA carboxylase biotin carboxyl carrier protein [Fredinandcohnia sp. SECRCQ15]MCH1626624.1 acetyl-CoA carboxylase biotin carboxyl carrier protein [Fredinandcohnia sp. SECRCQ15]
MLKIQELRELIKLVDQSNIDEFSYEHDGSKIKMKKHKEASTETVIRQKADEFQMAPVVKEVIQPVLSNVPSEPQAKKIEVVEEAPVSEKLHKIVSPMVGTFYASPSPDAENYVKTGDKVKTDTVVCIVEAMKLFNEIEAEVNGEIVEVLVENGQLVEYGQPLFLVK